MPRTSTRGGLLVVPSHEPSPALSLYDTPEVVAAKSSLRINWKWAYVSHFIFVYEPMLQLAEHFKISDIEDDLASGTALYTPRVLIRLMTCLTHDRKITMDNYQAILYRQFMRRAPEMLPGLVTSSYVPKVKKETRSRSQTVEEDATEANEDEDDEEEPEVELTEKIEWTTLTLDQKLNILHDLCEWQFTNPSRLRTNMKYDDDYASWRIEPVGYDSSLNSYYWLAGDRMWIQRAPPKRPRKTAKKGKGKAPAKSGRSQSKKGSQTIPKIKLPAKSPLNPRKRSAPSETPEPTTRSSKRIKKSESSTPSITLTRSGRPSRAAANDANKKIAALPQLPPPNPRGTRASARLRGAEEDELWQEIPPEWLGDEDSPMANGKYEDEDEDEGESDQENSPAPNANAFGSTGSELTELSDLSDPEEEEDEEEKEEEDNEEEDEEEVKEEDDEDEPKKAAAKDEDEDPPLPEGFVEWETVAITLADWEAFPKQFEGSTNYREKAFFRLLTGKEGIVKLVTEDMKEALKKKVQEEAISHRKRSSRIAIKESEKEEQRAAEIKKREEDEKLERARRAEARMKKEDEARKERERKREERRLAAERAAQEEETVEVVEPEPMPLLPAPGAQSKAASAKRPSKPRAKNPSSKSKIRRANGAIRGASNSEDWELDCEHCGSKGKNISDGTEITCCENCGKWQHTWCNDEYDRQTHRSKRDWAKTEFRCFDCTRRSRPALPVPASTHLSVNRNQQGPVLKLSPPGHVPGRPLAPYGAQHPSLTAGISYYPAPTAGGYQWTPQQAAYSRGLVPAAGAAPAPVHAQAQAPAARPPQVAQPLPMPSYYPYDPRLAQPPSQGGHQYYPMTPLPFNIPARPPSTPQQPITFAPNVSAESYRSGKKGVPPKPVGVNGTGKGSASPAPPPSASGTKSRPSTSAPPPPTTPQLDYSQKLPPIQLPPIQTAFPSPQPHLPHLPNGNAASGSYSHHSAYNGTSSAPTATPPITLAPLHPAPAPQPGN